MIPGFQGARSASAPRGRVGGQAAPPRAQQGMMMDLVAHGYDQAAYAGARRAVTPAASGRGVAAAPTTMQAPGSAAGGMMKSPSAGAVGGRAPSRGRYDGLATRLPAGAASGGASSGMRAGGAPGGISGGMVAGAYPVAGASGGGGGAAAGGNAGFIGAVAVKGTGGGAASGSSGQRRSASVGALRPHTTAATPGGMMSAASGGGGVMLPSVSGGGRYGGPAAGMAGSRSASTAALTAAAGAAGKRPGAVAGSSGGTGASFMANHQAAAAAAMAAAAAGARPGTSAGLVSASGGRPAISISAHGAAAGVGLGSPLRMVGTGQAVPPGMMMMQQQQQQGTLGGVRRPGAGVASATPGGGGVPSMLMRTGAPGTVSAGAFLSPVGANRIAGTGTPLSAATASGPATRVGGATRGASVGVTPQRAASMPVLANATGITNGMVPPSATKQQQAAQLQRKGDYVATAAAIGGGAVGALRGGSPLLHTAHTGGGSAGSQSTALLVSADAMTATTAATSTSGGSPSAAGVRGPSSAGMHTPLSSVAHGTPGGRSGGGSSSSSTAGGGGGPRGTSVNGSHAGGGPPAGTASFTAALAKKVYGSSVHPTGGSGSPGGGHVTLLRPKSAGGNGNPAAGGSAAAPGVGGGGQMAPSAPGTGAIPQHLAAYYASASGGLRPGTVPTGPGGVAMMRPGTSGGADGGALAGLYHSHHPLHGPPGATGTGGPAILGEAAAALAAGAGGVLWSPTGESPPAVHHPMSGGLGLSSAVASAAAAAAGVRPGTSGGTGMSMGMAGMAGAVGIPGYRFQTTTGTGAGGHVLTVPPAGGAHGVEGAASASGGTGGGVGMVRPQSAARQPPQLVFANQGAGGASSGRGGPQQQGPPSALAATAGALAGLGSAGSAGGPSTPQLIRPSSALMRGQQQGAQGGGGGGGSSGASGLVTSVAGYLVDPTPQRPQSAIGRGAGAPGPTTLSPPTGGGTPGGGFATHGRHPPESTGSPREGGGGGHGGGGSDGTFLTSLATQRQQQQQLAYSGGGGADGQAASHDVTSVGGKGAAAGGTPRHASGSSSSRAPSAAPGSARPGTAGGGGFAPSHQEPSDPAAASARDVASASGGRRPSGVGAAYAQQSGGHHHGHHDEDDDDGSGSHSMDDAAGDPPPGEGAGATGGGTGGGAPGGDAFGRGSSSSSAAGGGGSAAADAAAAGVAANAAAVPLDPAAAEAARKAAQRERELAARSRLKAIVAADGFDGHAGVEFYGFGKVLGTGSFGEVRLAWHRLAGVKVAIKSYEKSRITDAAQWKRVQQEVEVLTRLNHPNVLRMFETIDTPKRIHISTEFCSGGNLCTYVKSKGRLSEAESRRIFIQLLAGIEYLHNQGIVHRDIKLENVLFGDEKQDSMKLVDFGFAVLVTDPWRRLRVFCGTPSYMAPEICQRREYLGRPVDVWSLGVLLYAMLVGRFPFAGKTYPDLYKRIIAGQVNFPDHLSPSSKDLLRRMLTVDPARRLSLPHVETHPWVLAGGNGGAPTTPGGTAGSALFASPSSLASGGAMSPQASAVPPVMAPDRSILASADPANDINEAVLQRCEQLGFRRAQVVASVLARARDACTTTYYLLLTRMGRSAKVPPPPAPATSSRPGTAGVPTIGGLPVHRITQDAASAALGSGAPSPSMGRAGSALRPSRHGLFDSAGISSATGEGGAPPLHPVTGSGQDADGTSRRTHPTASLEDGDAGGGVMATPMRAGTRTARPGSAAPPSRRAATGGAGATPAWDDGTAPAGDYRLDTTADADDEFGGFGSPDATGTPHHRGPRPSSAALARWGTKSPGMAGGATGGAAAGSAARASSASATYRGAYGGAAADGGDGTARTGGTMLFGSEDGGTIVTQDATLLSEAGHSHAYDRTPRTHGRNTAASESHFATAAGGGGDDGDGDLIDGADGAATGGGDASGRPTTATPGRRR